jgi:hypothetical protein
MTTKGRAGIYALAAAITLYGALLRLDAYVGGYGPLDHPAWARVLTQDVAVVARAVRLKSVVWGRAAVPYVGGDLFNQQFVAQFNLERTAGRVGSYRVTLPRQWQRPGDNAVAIASSSPAGVRLWFVRIIPTGPPSNAH